MLAQLWLFAPRPMAITGGSMPAHIAQPTAIRLGLPASSTDDTRAIRSGAPQAWVARVNSCGFMISSLYMCGTRFSLEGFMDWQFLGSLPRWYDLS